MNREIIVNFSLLLNRFGRTQTLAWMRKRNKVEENICFRKESWDIFGANTRISKPLILHYLWGTFTWKIALNVTGYNGRPGEIESSAEMTTSKFQQREIYANCALHKMHHIISAGLYR